MLGLIALSTMAMTAAVPTSPLATCEMAPSMAYGTSNFGLIDSMYALNFGCSLPFNFASRWSIGPFLGISERAWSIFETDSQLTRFVSFQTRSGHVGGRLVYGLADGWGLSYTASIGSGKGRHAQQLSNVTSTQELAIPSFIYQELRHEFVLAHTIAPKFSVNGGVSFESARQSWGSAAGQISQEQVAPGNLLTLKDGLAADDQDSFRRSGFFKSVSLQLGIQLKFTSTGN